ncbi:glycosyltransferase [archaeon]|nr:MAG: glycosyltransferase [archaeon]
MRAGGPLIAHGCAQCRGLRVNSMVRKTNSVADWFCLQLGSREHYIIPRVLHGSERLRCLCLDAWVHPRWRSLAASVGMRSLGERYHADLATANVRACTISRLLFEAMATGRRLQGWGRIQARNAWFQRASVSMLTGELRERRETERRSIAFAYSYAALEPLRLLRSLGCKIVLGQIDPGPYEEEYVEKKAASYAHLRNARRDMAPPEYWKRAAQEWELADRIIVNSEWSRECMLRSGVDPAKIVTFPLALELGSQVDQNEKAYPSEFGDRRPMRVLFLGQVVLRKGVGQLFDAIQLLNHLPIHFTFAGPVSVRIPDFIKNSNRVTFVGPVTRQQTQELYKSADLFILPTLSDGFALTQLEARAQRLPCIVSQNCGRVVENAVDGIVIDDVSPDVIARVLADCSSRPMLLRELSRNISLGHAYSAASLLDNLMQLEADLFA